MRADPALMVDLNAIVAQWNAEYDRYDQFTRALVEDVEERLRMSGVKPIKVSGRPKDPLTFVTKMLRKGYERYEQVTDKSGVRVVVRMEREVDRVVDIIRRAYQCGVDDKRTTNDVGLFGYRAVHLQAFNAFQEYPGMDSEIQVRTICADAWSEMSHFLAYKSPIAIPAIVDRTQRALAGLFELADGEYERQFDALGTLPERKGANLLEMLVPIRLSLCGAPWDHEFSVTMLTALVPAYAPLEIEEIAQAVRTWVHAREGELRDLLDEASRNPSTRSPLLLQPEALVVGERLSARSERP